MYKKFIGGIDVVCCTKRLSENQRRVQLTQLCQRFAVHNGLIKLFVVFLICVLCGS